MKIIRWLLSHSLFILLIVAVIYCYMFWGNLLGKDTPAGKAVAYLSDEFVEVRDFVDAVKAKQAQLSGNKSQAEPGSDTVADSASTTGSTTAGAEIIHTAQPGSNNGEVNKSRLTETQSDAGKGVERRTETVTKQPVAKHVPAASAAPSANQGLSVKSPVNTSDSRTSMAIKQNIASNDTDHAVLPNNQLSATSNSSTPSANAFTDASSPGDQGAFVPADVEKELRNVNERGQVIDPSQPTGAVKDLWIQARKSYYQRDYELSEKSYQQVIKTTKNNFDAYGELGNVYFNQGKRKEAASAYFEAAAILIDMGQVNRARSLLGLMRHLDKAKANELQQLIDAAPL